MKEAKAVKLIRTEAPAVPQFAMACCLCWFLYQVSITSSAHSERDRDSGSPASFTLSPTLISYNEVASSLHNFSYFRSYYNAFYYFK